MEYSKFSSLSQNELCALISRVYEKLSYLNSKEESDIPYDAKGQEELFLSEICAISDAPAPEGGVPDPEKLAFIFENAKTKLARSAALNVYKKARLSISDSRLDDGVEAVIYPILEAEKARHRDYGEPHDVTGSASDERYRIYTYDDGPHVREVHIKSKKAGKYPIEIVQITDLHYNHCNEKDIKEANPALMSTLENRVWLANGDSVRRARHSVDYADYSDVTVVTGDLLDYLSEGCRELTVKELFRRDVGMLACLGNHEATREMQGVIPDPSSFESRLDILREYWCNDIKYESAVYGDRVMLCVLDNSSTWEYTYTEEQYERLLFDIKYARENGLIILLFEHEPLCTANPAEADVPFIKYNDANGSRNFFENYRGSRHPGGASEKTWMLIRQSSDVIKAHFCGHRHSSFYTEILGCDENGEPDGTIIPQYVVTGAIYDSGNVMKITVE